MPPGVLELLRPPIGLIRPVVGVLADPLGERVLVDRQGTPYVLTSA